ncbi:MAG: GFA family protein [Xanthobacteraceae bacterium]|nr:MAG: GFA family protein [Xanthobacteraceae bacterium]
MTEPRTYTGGCHCGLVRFECTSDLATVTACNCSICTKKGLHLTFLPPSSFTLRAGGDVLREYRFHKKVIGHQFCAECGTEVYANGAMPDGTPIVAVNVSCLDGIDLAEIKMRPHNGRAD